MLAAGFTTRPLAPTWVNPSSSSGSGSGSAAPSFSLAMNSSECSAT